MFSHLSRGDPFTPVPKPQAPQYSGYRPLPGPVCPDLRCEGHDARRVAVKDAMLAMLRPAPKGPPAAFSKAAALRNTGVPKKNPPVGGQVADFETPAPSQPSNRAPTVFYELTPGARRKAGGAPLLPLALLPPFPAADGAATVIAFVLAPPLAPPHTRASIAAYGGAVAPESSDAFVHYRSCVAAFCCAF